MRKRKRAVGVQLVILNASTQTKEIEITQIRDLVLRFAY
jgi:hypothetical protein